MTDMLVRPLADNRMLRAAGGADLTVTLGQSLGAVFDTPMMTGLVGQSWAEAGASLDAFTEQQRIDLRQSEFDRQQEVSNLETELNWSTDERRDEITSRLGELSKERDVQIQAETQRSIDEGRLQQPESLNELYGELNLKFDRPMTEGEARLLADNKRAEMIRQSIISKGPAGVLPGLAKFGAGLAAMAVDPLEVGSMFIPVVGVSGRLAATARFGKVGGRVLVGATEGFVGSALTEPIYYGLSRQQQLDYTMSDALLNVGLGFAFGGGIGAISSVFARADVDVVARVDGEPLRVDMPEAARIAPEVTPTRVDIDPVAARAARVEADTSIRQFVNDQSVDVSILTARPPARPQTLMEFVRKSGGINDEAVTFRDELKNMGINPAPRNNGVNNPTSRFDLDDMADQAFQGGFIESRDVGLLTEKLRSEVGGEFAFSKGDTQKAQAWRDFHQTRTDLEAFIADQDGIKAELSRLGVTDATDAEVGSISDLMAVRGIELDDAIEQVLSKDVKAERASGLAQKAETDPYADYAAAKAYNDFVGDDFASEAFINEDIQKYDAMIKQMEEADDLTPEQKAMIAEVNEMEAHAKAYAEVTEAASICMGRT